MIVYVARRTERVCGIQAHVDRFELPPAALLRARFGRIALPSRTCVRLSFAFHPTTTPVLLRGMFSACAVRTALRGFLFSIQPMWRVGLRVCPHGGWPTGLPTLLTLVVVTIVFNHHCQQCSGAFRFHGHSSLLCTDWRRAPESRLTLRCMEHMIVCVARRTERGIGPTSARFAALQRAESTLCAHRACARLQSLVALVS